MPEWLSSFFNMAKKVTSPVQPRKKYIPKYIIVHHSAAKAPVPQFDSINEWHKERDFVQSELGYYVGYHRVIEKSGEVRIARGDLERDCDALGHNFDSLSVCMVGNFDMEDPTPQQIAALASILQEWCKAYSFTSADIHIHREFAPTNCPGIRVTRPMVQAWYLQSELKRVSKELAAITSVAG